VYQELHRVLRPGGALYHYIGDPASTASGRLFAGVKSRLAAAGFDAVRTAPAAFGVTASAGRPEHLRERGTKRRTSGVYGCAYGWGDEVEERVEEGVGGGRRGEAVDSVLALRAPADRTARRRRRRRGRRDLFLP